MQVGIETPTEEKWILEGRAHYSLPWGTSDKLETKPSHGNNPSN